MQNPASVAACACATAIPRARHEFSHYIIAYTARRRVGAWWWTAVCMVAAANLILPFFPVWIASTRASRIHTYSSCVIEMRWHSFHTIRGSHFILCNSNMHICLSAQTDSRNMIFTWMHWSAVWACHLFEKAQCRFIDAYRTVVRATILFRDVEIVMFSSVIMYPILWATWNNNESSQHYDWTWTLWW